MKYEGKVRLAIFESNEKYSWRTLYTEEEAKATTYTRVSEWVEIEFQLVEDLVMAKVQGIEKEIECKKAETLKEIKELTAWKQELLAIGYDRLDKDNNELLIDDEGIV